jgi:hypothetical protein
VLVCVAVRAGSAKGRSSARTDGIGAPCWAPMARTAGELLGDLLDEHGIAQMRLM